MNNLHILVIDDHAIFRQGLSFLLCKAVPACQITETDSMEQAMALAIPMPDLVLLDIKLPGLSGIEGIALLKQRWPKLPVIILSALNTPEAMSEALLCGACGYISKASSAKRILEQITEVMLQTNIPADTIEPLNGHLTPRQREVLGFLNDGLSNKLIARRMALSENTVRRHVQDILEYFQVDSRSVAVAMARRRGLTE